MAVLQALRHVVTAGQICIHGPAEDACSVVSLVWGPGQGCDLLQPINGAQHRLEMSKLHVGQSPPIPSDCCLWGCRQVCQAFRPSYSAPMHMQISENPHQQPLPCTLAHLEKSMQALRQGRKHLLQACQLQQARFLNVHEYQVWPQEEIQH